MTLAGLFALALSRAGAGADPGPDEVLTQAKAKVLASADRMPAYTCVETVERHYYSRTVAPAQPHECSAVIEEELDPEQDLRLRLFATDRLRLDVTATDRAEIYSWVGASRFEDAGIDKIVHNGPIGTGAFAGFLGVIFGTDVKQFRYEGHKLIERSDLMEYSFQVPIGDSHYKIKLAAPDEWIATAYSGSVFVNPATGGVVRLRVETAELPASTRTCRTRTTLDFGIVQMGAMPFLLPASSRQQFLATNGEVENITRFANCREYRGESTITFDPPPDSLTVETGKSLPQKPLSVAAGIPFTMELLERIDTDRAAAGDPFRARLVSALRDQKSRVLAPGGSIVEGRLRRVESIVSPKQVYVALAPGTLWIGNERVALAATRDWTKVSHGTPVSFLLPMPGEEPSGVFPFPGQHVVVPAGFRSDWRTVRAAADR